MKYEKIEADKILGRTLPSINDYRGHSQEMIADLAFLLETYPA